MGHPIAEQHAIRKGGKRIVLREIAQILLGLFPFNCMPERTSKLLRGRPVFNHNLLRAMLDHLPIRRFIVLFTEHHDRHPAQRGLDEIQRIQTMSVDYGPIHENGVERLATQPMQGVAETLHMGHLDLPLLRLLQQIKGKLRIVWIILD
jgi:hypothetical protein